MNSIKKKANAYLDANPVTDKISTVDKLIILSDSKGKYLKSEFDKLGLTNPHILWWCQSGRRTEDGVKKLDQMINWLTAKGDKVYVLFWHCTCDLSVKQGKYIFQRHRWTTELIEHLSLNFEKLVQLNSRHSNVNIGILETPPIFTKQWNKSRDYDFVDGISDSDLHEQVKETNKIIREYNIRLGFTAPKFECDFIWSRRDKKKGSSGTTTTRYTFSSALNRDGVHPIDIIAKKWLFKILNKFLQDRPTKDQQAK